MARIPVGESIGFGYRFFFGRIGTVLAAAGIPALLYAAAEFTIRAYAASYFSADPGTAPGGDVALVGILALAVQLFAASYASIAMTRIVFAERGFKTSLSFAGSVLRMAAANIRFIAGAGALIVLAIGVSALGFALAGAGNGVAAGDGVAPGPGLSLLVATLLSWGLFLYAFVSMLRMGFFLAPIVAAERKGGLVRSHELTGGNVWRAIAVSSALIVPVVVLAFLAMGTLIRSALGDEPVVMGPDAVMRIQQAIQTNLLVWEAISAALFVFFAGLVHSGIAFAYAAVIRPDAPRADGG